MPDINTTDFESEVTLSIEPENTEPTPEVEAKAVQTTEETPWWKEAGFESEDDLKALDWKKVKNLDKWEREVNKKSSELGAVKAEPEPVDENDPWSGLDKDSREVLQPIIDY